MTLLIARTLCGLVLVFAGLRFVGDGSGVAFVLALSMTWVGWILGEEQ